VAATGRRAQGQGRCGGHHSASLERCVDFAGSDRVGQLARLSLSFGQQNHADLQCFHGFVKSGGIGDLQIEKFELLAVRAVDYPRTILSLMRNIRSVPPMGRRICAHS